MTKRPFLDRTALILCGIVILALAAAWAGLLSNYYIGLITEAVIIALFVMSLDLLAGFTGLESLGHAAFFGLGAYIAALLSMDGYENAILLLAAGGIGALLLAMPYGAVALRATGPYFLIITMALGYLPWALAIRWRSLTGGDDGLPGVFRPKLFGLSLDGVFPYFVFVMVTVLICTLILSRIAVSSFGQSLKGIKDSPSRMEALGYNIWLHKYVCFLIAAFFAGIAGAMFGFYNSFVSPNDLSLYRSAEALVAVILGGAGTLLGPAAGAVLILFLRFSAGAVTKYWGLVLGLVYIGVVLFAPQGLFATLRQLLARDKR